jgi:protein-disulfide isomerase
MGKGARTASARERITAQREAQRKREQRKRIATIVTVAVVAMVAIGAGWWFSAQSAQPESQTATLAPITVQADGSAVMAKAGVTKPVLDVYEDFQCPVCKQLEDTSGPTIKNLAAEGKVKVVFHPITIFAAEPTRSNSLRASAAMRCVPDGTQWMAYHDKLYAEQPSETVEGFKLDELVGWGNDVGVTASGFDQCVTSQRHLAEHQQYSAKILGSEKLEGTPTLKLNGTVLDGKTAFVPSALRDAVLNAAK